MTPVPNHPGPLVAGDWDATVTDWLASLFLAPPTADTVTSYRHGLGAMLLEELKHHPGCHDGAGLMQAALTSPRTPAMLARQLGTAFMQLFEGAGGPADRNPPLGEGPAAVWRAGGRARLRLLAHPH